jgi:hypothetical protein
MHVIDVQELRRSHVGGVGFWRRFPRPQSIELKKKKMEEKVCVRV